MLALRYASSTAEVMNVRAPSWEGGVSGLERMEQVDRQQESDRERRYDPDGPTSEEVMGAATSGMRCRLTYGHVAEKR